MSALVPRAAHPVLPSVQEHWFQQVNHLARVTPVLHTPLLDYARYGVVLFGVLLLAGWWLARGVTRVDRPGRLGERGRFAALTAALWAPVGTLVAVGVNQPLVNGFAEPRPYTVFPHDLALIAPSHDFSFPSDHSVMAGAVVAGVVILARRLAGTSKSRPASLLVALAVLAALAMAFARVYVAAHWPLDVVIGLAVGALVTALGYVVLRPVLERVVGAVASLVSPTPLAHLLGGRHR